MSKTLRPWEVNTLASLLTFGGLAILGFVSGLRGAPPQAPRVQQAPPVIDDTVSVSAETRTCGCGGPGCECGDTCDCLRGARNCSGGCPCEKTVLIKKNCCSGACTCGCNEGGPCGCGGARVRVVPAAVAAPAPQWTHAPPPAALTTYQPIYRPASQYQPTYQQPAFYPAPRQQFVPRPMTYQQPMRQAFAASRGGGC